MKKVMIGVFMVMVLMGCSSDGEDNGNGSDGESDEEKVEVLEVG